MKNDWNDRWNDHWNKKKILITGVTSGLGRALALEALRQGAVVAGVARTGERLQALARETGIHVIEADVSRKTDTYRIAGETLGKLGGLDVLVNGASELGPTPLRGLLDTPCEELAHVLETNLVGPFRLTKALLPTLLLQGHGLVVNISSDAAVNAYARWGSYGVSKAALDQLSRIWNAELEAHPGVRFLAVDPGDMDTPMHAAAVPDADPRSLKSPADVARALLLGIAEGRFDRESRVAL